MPAERLAMRRACDVVRIVNWRAISEFDQLGMTRSRIGPHERSRSISRAILSW
jgi:hypothetical protein